MKKYTLVILFLCLAMGSFAQSKDETAVADAVNTLYEGFKKADKNILLQYTHPAVSYGHSSGLIENQAQVVEVITSGKNQYKSIDVKDQTISIVGKNAIVRHKVTFESVNHGTASTVNLNVLTVWLKSGKKWQLLARHASRITN